jgi:hypothetical protein
LDSRRRVLAFRSNIVEGRCLVKKIGLLVFVVLIGSAVALGEDKKSGGGDNVRYSKTTTISFEDDTIEGDLSRPDGEYVEAIKKVKHSNLIRVREEFKDKVMQSVGEL